MDTAASQARAGAPLRRNPLARWWLYALTLICGAASYAWVLIPLLHYPIEFKESETKRRLHQIEVALGAYGLANGGRLPADINDLITFGYLAQLPANAFTGRPMRAVRFGQPGTAGDFVYLTLLDDDQCINGTYSPADYVLYAIGHESSEGYRIYDYDGEYRDTYLARHQSLHIIMILTSLTYGHCKGGMGAVSNPGPAMIGSDETIADALVRTGYR